VRPVSKVTLNFCSTMIPTLQIEFKQLYLRVSLKNPQNSRLKRKLRTKENAFQTLNLGEKTTLL
jgi:hypothetical protein